MALGAFQRWLYMKKKSLSVVNVVLLVALVVLVAVSAYFTFSVPTPKVVEQKIAAVQADFLGADCEECFNLSVAFEFLGQQPGMQIVEVRNYTRAESAELAAKYNISRLPALILTGEIENRTIPSFESSGDALVFAQAPPPYYDVAEKRVKGIVSVVQLQSDCEECFNASLLVDQLRSAGVTLSEVRVVRADTGEGNDLVSKYAIEKLPTLIFNKDALEYDVVSQVWPTVGSIESDGSLVLRMVNPPYVNVSTGKTQGLVGMTYLADSSCKECFNESAYQELFEKGFGMHFSDMTSVDVSSARGKMFINKYGIELVPTAILSIDAGLYPAVGQVWSQAGTQEKDGAFVFRTVPLMENVIGAPIVYKNLSSNSTVDTTPAVLDEPDIAPATAEE